MVRVLEIRLIRTFAFLLAAFALQQTSVGIYNGRRVRSEEAIASFVRFGSRIGRGRRLVCGGVLITWRHVLTAAHCRLSPERHQAFMGSRLLRTRDVPLVLNISSFDVHKRFKRLQLTSDVALVTLENPPDKSALEAKGIHPIRVDWKVSRSPDGRKMFAIGFGVTKAEEKGEPSRVLRNGTIFKLNTDTCVSRWYRAADRNGILCAHSGKTTTVCSGDSGGPIVVYKKTRTGKIKLYLMGIISAVVCQNDVRCCTPGAPVLSMNIEPFKEWVERRVGREKRWK